MYKFRPLALIFAVFACVLPAFANEHDDNLKLIFYAIQMEGYDCGALVGSPMPRDEAMAFDVTCAANTDGTGAETRYFVQIMDQGFLIKPQEG
ncbi:MAG: hypothetical protein V3V13_06335 [Paracoccaceae bacterium]